MVEDEASPQTLSQHPPTLIDAIIFLRNHHSILHPPDVTHRSATTDIVAGQRAGAQTVTSARRGGTESGAMVQAGGRNRVEPRGFGLCDDAAVDRVRTRDRRWV